jgi:hypothetical protein
MGRFVCFPSPQFVTIIVTDNNMSQSHPPSFNTTDSVVTYTGTVFSYPSTASKNCPEQWPNDSDVRRIKPPHQMHCTRRHPSGRWFVDGSDGWYVFCEDVISPSLNPNPGGPDALVVSQFLRFLNGLQGYYNTPLFYTLLLLFILRGVGVKFGIWKWKLRIEKLLGDCWHFNRGHRDPVARLGEKNENFWPEQAQLNPR